MAQAEQYSRERDASQRAARIIFTTLTTSVDRFQLPYSYHHCLRQHLTPYLPACSSARNRTCLQRVSIA